MTPLSQVSTGIGGLDEILNSLQMGDNVVFQVDEIADYKAFVKPYVQTSLEQKRTVVYMRFADHPPLLKEDPNIKIYKLNARSGFESFSTQVHNIVRDEGRDVFYVFDCLSDLLMAWATDLMIGNFFVITCPYLFELNTVAYFAILRGRHSYKTVARIRETTQVLLDIYNNKGKLCVHPLKAWKRYTPTMFLPHIMEGDRFVPILNSADAASLLSHLTGKISTSGVRNLDYWDRIFWRAKEILEDPAAVKEKQEMVEKLKEYVPEPVLTVDVKQINSMIVYVTGRVTKPGQYLVNTRVTVLQAISIAGGLNAFAKRGKIKVFRQEDGKTVTFPFDYDEVIDGENLQQNIVLKRGDVVVVP